MKILLGANDYTSMRTCAHARRLVRAFLCSQMTLCRFSCLPTRTTFKIDLNEAADYKSRIQLIDNPRKPIIRDALEEKTLTRHSYHIQTAFAHAEISFLTIHILHDSAML